MDKEKLDKLKKIFNSAERTIEKGQELARATLTKEPSQRSQNIYWRSMMQDMRDIKSIVMEDTEKA